MLSPDTLVVTRVFDAPRKVVFAAWTDARHAARWWGPGDFALLSCEMDVRPGGRWRRRMRSPDGVLSVKLGRYREIVPDERLVFTYADENEDGSTGPETEVTVTFATEGSKTRLTLLQTGFASVEARDAHHDGWSSCLERFADHLLREKAA